MLAADPRHRSSTEVVPPTPNLSANGRSESEPTPTRRADQEACPLLSIVIPAHNEEQRLPHSLAQIDAFLARQTFESEVIVVENGSVDRTAEVVAAWAADKPYVRLFRETARGKGLAVRRGMLEARGQLRFICDSDLSMPIEELAKFLPPRLTDYDLAIASRETLGSRRIGEPFYRHFIGRVNNFLVKLLAIRRFEDTQCGFKCFRDRVAEDLFSVQRLNGIGFDVELLYVADKRGYRIVEVPVDWYFNADSRMRLFQDSARMIAELLELRRNWRRGLYAPRREPA